MNKRDARKKEKENLERKEKKEEMKAFCANVIFFSCLKDTKNILQ